jgi:peptidase A4-like protein
MVACALTLTGTLVTAIGVSPASARSARSAARSTASARHHAVPKGYTHPADNSINSACQPTVPKPCPKTNNVWSGYVLTPTPGHTFTSVSGNWIQTSATCPQSDAWALFWVGLDGWSSFDSQTVEQGGTSAQCVDGTPIAYYAWWEMYPTNSVEQSYPIRVGDHISSSVVYSAANETYTITVNDVTSGDSLVVVSALSNAAVNPNTYTVTTIQGGVTTVDGPTSYGPSQVCNVGMPCQNTSAEWVVEAPGGNNGGAGSLYPLAHFRRITFTGANAVDNLGNSGSITDSSTWSDSRVYLTSTSGKYLANVTGLKKSGTQFRDIWDRYQG